MTLNGFIRRGRAARRDGAETLAHLVPAAPALQERLGLTAERRAAVCITPVDAAAFSSLISELAAVLAEAGRSRGTTLRRLCDDFGFQWFVLEDDDSLSDLVDAVQRAERALVARGLAAHLLCAVFTATGPDGPVHLVHAPRTGRFHPVVPGAGGRDDGAEERVRRGLQDLLPMETDRDRCFPVWGAPV